MSQGRDTFAQLLQCTSMCVPPINTRTLTAHRKVCLDASFFIYVRYRNRYGNSARVAPDAIAVSLQHSDCPGKACESPSNPISNRVQGENVGTYTGLCQCLGEM